MYMYTLASIHDMHMHYTCIFTPIKNQAKDVFCHASAFHRLQFQPHPHNCVCTCVATISCQSPGAVLFVTIHGKTILHTKSFFEIRQPLPCMAFGLQLEKKVEFSSPCSFGDMCQNVPGSPVLKFSSKRYETLSCTLHTEVHILAIYAKYVAPPTKSMSLTAAKTLEREQ